MPARRAAIAALLTASLLLGLGLVLSACSSADASDDGAALDTSAVTVWNSIDLSDYKGKPLFLVFMAST